MPRIVILTLSDPAGCADKPRVPVLACADGFRKKGAIVDLITACEEEEIDAALKPVEAGEARLVVAAATDSQLRAVVRRMVRRHAPPPSKRPAELPAHRTVFDLPPLAVLPLAPAMPDLVLRLGLPTEPDSVAGAVLGGQVRRLDLFRHDGGSVTLNGAMVGGVDNNGTVVPWMGQIAVDDAVLTDGDEPVLACSIQNVGSSEVDGLPLVVDADPTDGQVEVAVALPLVKRRRLRGTSIRFEVRRARGRAMSVYPRDQEVHYVDDGVVGTLGRKRSWWVERAVWAAYVM
jgi:hypothetical protein